MESLFQRQLSNTVQIEVFPHVKRSHVETVDVMVVLNGMP